MVEKYEKERKKVDFVLKNFIEISSKKEKVLLRELAKDLKKSKKFQLKYEF